MRWTLLPLLFLLLGCELFQEGGYRVGEAQLLFPEATERWTYFYGEPQEVGLSVASQREHHEEVLRLTEPKGESLWAVPGALFVNGLPLYRETGPALAPVGETVHGAFDGRLRIRARSDLASVWLYDGRGWVKLTGNLERGREIIIPKPPSYTTPTFSNLLLRETQVLLREILARRGNKPVVVYELQAPVLRPLPFNPPPVFYRAQALGIQYGVEVEILPPPPPTYRILDKGPLSAYRETTPKAILALNPNRFAEGWELVVGNRIPRPAAPQVDFGNRAAAFFFWGLKPTGGYGMDVVGVSRVGNTARVVLDLTTPKPGTILTQALTSPYVIVELERVQKVVFTNRSGRVLAEDAE
ncbi:MAG: protease complex subunit PrcB family protein [Thermaceae bacterium]